MSLPPRQSRTTLSPHASSYSGMGDLLAGRRKQSILVVDDNLMNAALLKEMLASRGYQTTAVTNAAAAEVEIRREAPDLILLDVIMPGKSGYELCRELKADSKTRLIPIVMITGLTDREDRLKGIEAGADDFLTKPISSEELFARVSSLLKLKEFTDDLGKIAVPDEILKKGGNLTPAEWEIMMQHPVTGETICRPLTSLRLVLPIIRYHHEHSDGSGYPDGLSKSEIPLLPRILQVVDIYDALRSARPYKPALAHEPAALTMRAEARSGLWDEELVSEFFSMLDKRREA